MPAQSKAVQNMNKTNFGNFNTNYQPGKRQIPIKPQVTNINFY